MEFKECDLLAKAVRLDCLKMVHAGKSGHIGSMLSCAEILAVLYKKILNVSPDAPKAPERDRLIFSKGHGGAALFATLAELGYFPKAWLDTYYQDAGKLSGHISHHVPGVEFSTGSLGHGLPVACGMAMFHKNSGSNQFFICDKTSSHLDGDYAAFGYVLAGMDTVDKIAAVNTDGNDKPLENVIIESATFVTPLK